ncbi:MAG: ABC transporter substrate-binding protein [Alphaproteobacteria bacterium]|nr:ABC transporter substrate-binding protein [Alphaproteobacteria bacterium]
MKKWLLSLCMVLALVACKEEKKQEAQAEAKPVVKIGVSLPLTGDIAYMGQALKGAVMVAEQQLKDNNKLKNDYQFIIEDNAYNTKTVMAINNKFAWVDKVNAIVDFASNPGLVTSQFAEKNKIIHINTGSSDRNVAKGEYNFSHTTLPDMEAKVLVRDILSNYKNVALIVLNEASGIAAAAEMTKEMDANNIKYIQYIVNDGEKDMRGLIEKIEQNNPDIYVVTLYSPNFDVLYKQMQEKGINKPITSTNFMDLVNNLSMLPDGTQWVTYPSPEPVIREKILEVNKGVTTSELCIGNIYDAVMMVVEAFENSNNNEEALSYLNNLQTFTGVYGQVDIHDGILNVPAIRKELKDGKPLEVKE